MVAEFQTTAHLYWLYTSLNKDNAGSGACGYIVSAEKNLKTDLLIKAFGFIAGMVFYPPLVEIGVLVAAVFMISGRISLRKENSLESSDLEIFYAFGQLSRDVTELLCAVRNLSE